MKRKFIKKQRSSVVGITLLGLSLFSIVLLIYQTFPQAGQIAAIKDHLIHNPYTALKPNPSSRTELAITPIPESKEIKERSEGSYEGEDYSQWEVAEIRREISRIDQEIENENLISKANKNLLTTEERNQLGELLKKRDQLFATQLKRIL